MIETCPKCGGDNTLWSPDDFWPYCWGCWDCGARWEAVSTPDGMKRLYKKWREQGELDVKRTAPPSA